MDNCCHCCRVICSNSASSALPFITLNNLIPIVNPNLPLLPNPQDAPLGDADILTPLFVESPVPEVPPGPDIIEVDVMDVILTIPSTEIATFRNVLLQCINNFRIRNGRVPLLINSPLQFVAQRHTRRMALASRLYHNPNLASEVTAAGYRWRALGENIAYTWWPGSAITVANRICNMWLNSAGHRANILYAGFRHIGIGYVRATNGRVWSTIVLGQPA